MNRATTLPKNAASTATEHHQKGFSKMTNEHVDECYARFDMKDEDLSHSGLDLEGLTAQRLIRLADNMDNVIELLGAVVDQLPNDPDTDRARAMLAGALALQVKQRGDMPSLVGGVLGLMSTD